MPQGLRLKNYITGLSFTERLHEQEQQVENSCTPKRCVGSIVYNHGYAVLSRSRDEVTTMARDFFKAFFASTNSVDSSGHTKRWEEASDQITSTGTYDLTEEELLFGAKLAWRNASRCIGRMHWNNLKLFDARHVKTTKEMFDAICNHVTYATNNGNIRSTITVFRQRREGEKDFRVWNHQLISYAGYKMEDNRIVGDPVNVEFTRVCQKLGWKGNGKQWDILPIVVSNGGSPDIFELPPEIVLQVNLTHPKFDWFEALGLRWYVLPAISGMLFDIGGIQFPAAPFNGWYMVTEISCRDLCDPQRYNILELVAAEMGEDTSTNTTLWKDRVVLEVTVAVIHSFQQKVITTVDHHTASDNFMKHLNNEQLARNGCPADWVWIVPPMSGSLTSVFHQEMVQYSLKPSYEYQDSAWKFHDWGVEHRAPKYSLKHVARVVQATLRIYSSVLKRRVKVTILFASETGRSQMFANLLSNVFAFGLSPKVICMADYHFEDLPQESLVIVVTSTFGNGDAPDNGERFARKLHGTVESEATITTEQLSSSNVDGNSFPLDTINENKGLLRNVRFCVFALGSSVYPNYCAFGHHIDELLGKLGAQRLLPVEEADEIAGQEKIFNDWLADVYPAVCSAFNLSQEMRALDLRRMSTAAMMLTADSIRFVKARGELLEAAFSKTFKKQVSVCKVVKRTTLYNNAKSNKSFFLLEMSCNEAYQPGDHVGIFPVNRPELVDGILARLSCSINPMRAVRVQMLDESSQGSTKVWIQYPNIPCCSLRILLSRFLDITTPLKPTQLEKLSAFAADPKEKSKLGELALDASKYENWRSWHHPHLLEVMEQFPSLAVPPTLLVTLLQPLQPRFYSISSSPEAHPGQIHLTVATIQFNTRDGNGPVHYGVCSNYLDNVSPGDCIHMFIQKSKNFALPEDLTKPVIMIGPGTGIAPFRGFWEQRLIQLKASKTGADRDSVRVSRMWLFAGCRIRKMDLYREEKDEVVRQGALEKTFLALSREPKIPKTYVQDVLRQEGAEVYRRLNDGDGHVYICGDVTMAEGVSQTLLTIFQTHGQMNEEGAQKFFMKLKAEKRYHEDIFGVVHFTPAVGKMSIERRVTFKNLGSASRIRSWFC